MQTIAPARPAELQLRRVRLPAEPASVRAARRQVQAAIHAWHVPVDPDAAVLLTSELVTNAIRHEAGQTILLVIGYSSGRLRIDVHDTSRSLPTAPDGAADMESGRGLLLVDTLSAEWGFHCTRAGKAVYFTLASQPGAAPQHADAACRGSPGAAAGHSDHQGSGTQSRGSNVGTAMAGELTGEPGAALHWVKSSWSFSNGNCVEVAALPDGGVGVRNSRDPEGPVLRFTPGEWHAFLGGARNGEFDRFGRK